MRLSASSGPASGLERARVERKRRDDHVGIAGAPPQLERLARSPPARPSTGRGRERSGCGSGARRARRPSGTRLSPERLPRRRGARPRPSDPASSTRRRVRSRTSGSGRRHRSVPRHSAPARRARTLASARPPPRRRSRGLRSRGRSRASCSRPRSRCSLRGFGCPGVADACPGATDAVESVGADIRDAQLVGHCKGFEADVDRPLVLVADHEEAREAAQDVGLRGDAGASWSSAAASSMLRRAFGSPCIHSRSPMSTIASAAFSGLPSARKLSRASSRRSRPPLSE